MAIFLGAGASVSSGVPTASGLVWEFKRDIYSSETGTHPARIGSLIDPTVREELQRYFDAQAGFPRRDVREVTNDLMASNEKLARSNNRYALALNILTGCIVAVGILQAFVVWGVSSMP